MSRGRLSLIVLIALMASALWMVKGAPIQALPMPGTARPAGARRLRRTRHGGGLAA